MITKTIPILRSLIVLLIILIENRLERYNYGNCDDIGHVNKFHANKKKM